MSSISNNTSSTSGAVFDSTNVVVHNAAYGAMQKAIPGLFEGEVKCVSKAAEGDIPFGSIVVQGTADNRAKVPTAVADGAGILGVTIASANDGASYKDKTLANVATEGHVWMKHGEATELVIAAGDVVYSTYDGKLKAAQSDDDYFVVGKALTSITSTSAEDVILVDVNK